MTASKKARHTVDRLAGRVKENIGEMTGNERLRSEGKVDQVKARVKMSGERFKDAFRGR
ncbi:MAG: CsbD family protein [Mycobacterium sp.]